MTTWHEIGSINAQKENERRRQDANARASIGPISDVNQTLKEIKDLLIEIRNAMNTEKVVNTPPYPLGWATLGVPASALDQALDL